MAKLTQACLIIGFCGDLYVTTAGAKKMLKKYLIDVAGRSGAAQTGLKRAK